MSGSAWVRHVKAAITAHSGPSPGQRIESIDYDAYWRERGVPAPTAPRPDDPWDYPRFVAMASVMDRTERIVDIGCGDGSFLAFLHDRGFRNLVGIDTSAVVVESLRCHGYTAFQSSLEELDIAAIGPTDVAVFSEVLEHVPESELLLGRVAMKVGRVVLSHPNIGYWPHRMRFLTGRFPIQWAWHPGEHVRFFTVLDLLEHLERAGYEVLSLQAPVGVPSERLRGWRPNLFADHVVIEARTN